MKEKLAKIREEILKQIDASENLDKLNEVRVSALGKKGALTELLKSMKEVAPQDRPKVGQMVNEVRAEIETALETEKAKLEDRAMEARLKNEVIDVTLPAKKNSVGHRHPNTIALEEVERIFVGMGYEVVRGPEVEKDYYNFEALNIPKDHPARDEQDTFYINEEIVLRTQTSPVQVRTMEQGKLPIRMIAPGRVFRSDEVDATHSPSFHQIEGLVIDKNISFADLKGTLEVFAKELFGPDTKTKFRPHHFPFTEPSAEVDVSCFKCGGKGCRFCKGSVEPNKSFSPSSVQRNSSLPQLMPATSNTIVIKELDTLFFWWWLSLALAIPTFGIGGIARAVFFCMLLYKYWNLVQTEPSSMTPGKAVGFLFIPVFGLYWMFVSIWGLGKAFNALTDLGKQKLETMPLIACICGATAPIAWGLMIIGANTIFIIGVFFTLVYLGAIIGGLVFYIITMINFQNAARTIIQRQ